jgi:hypothetical protein
MSIFETDQHLQACINKVRFLSQTGHELMMGAKPAYDPKADVLRQHLA